MQQRTPRTVEKSARRQVPRSEYDYYFKPEVCIEVDNKYRRPCREVLRSWCGSEATDRFDELIALRKEIRRVGEVVQSAIDALRSAGHKSQASQLQRDLGTPVEMLQHTETDR